MQESLPKLVFIKTPIIALESVEAGYGRIGKQGKPFIHWSFASMLFSLYEKSYKKHVEEKPGKSSNCVSDFEEPISSDLHRPVSSIIHPHNPCPHRFIFKQFVPSSVVQPEEDFLKDNPTLCVDDHPLPDARPLKKLPGLNSPIPARLKPIRAGKKMMTQQFHHSTTPVSEACDTEERELVEVSPAFDRVIHVIQHSGFRVGSDREDDGGREALDVTCTRQRSEALEGLLELAADLLQSNRLEELAVVLKPFGRDKVSPRETVIWLARSLKGMMGEGCESSNS